MAKKKVSQSVPNWLRPRVIVGTDHAGLTYRLTIQDDGKMLMERTRYVSDHADGWSQDFEDQTVEASNYYWLIDRIETNPADWPAS